jgi:predicted HTH domain antitoxin
MSDEQNLEVYEKRAWQYFLQLQPSITDVNAAAELAFRAVDAFEKELKRRKQQR